MAESIVWVLFEIYFSFQLCVQSFVDTLYANSPDTHTGDHNTFSTSTQLQQ